MTASRTHRITQQWVALGPGSVAVTVLTPNAPLGGAFVIVPSIGHEDLSMHRGQVFLARRLAEHHTVLIPQHWGTDQSQGTLDDDQVVERWVEGLTRVLDMAHSDGLGPVTVIGARLGALVASQVLPHPAVSGLVLWSPIVSGQRFVRSLAVMEAAGSTIVDTADGINVGGFRYPQALVDSLATLRAPTDRAPAPRVLVIDDTSRPCPPTYLDRLGASGVALEHVQTDDIAAWTAAAQYEAHLPMTSIDAITRWWQANGSPAPGAASSGVLLGDSRSAETAPAPPTNEQFLSLVDNRLNAIYSVPDGTPRPIGIVLDSTLGPGRSYVGLARQQRDAGRSVLRYDFAGYRWSSDRADPRLSFEFDSRDISDLDRVIDQLADAEGRRDVVLIGFCGGSNLLLRAATLEGVRGVIAINPPLYDLSIDPDRPRRDRTESARTLVRRAVYAVRFFKGARRAHRVLDTAANNGVSVLMLFDDNDTGFRFWNLTIARRLRKWTEKGLITVEARPDIGHNLEGADLQQVLSMVNEFVDRVEAIGYAGRQPV